MNSTNRLKEASELIKQKGFVSVQELMDYFKVSDMTIRRDLQKLEESKEFQRFHGGIRYLDELPIDKRMKKHALEKKSIATYCLSLINSGDTIILDSGTTTYQIAGLLAKSDIKNITVLTNSLNIAFRLRNADGVALLLSGGELRRSSQSFVGNLTRNFFENMFVDKAFISTGGIVNKGFSTTSMAEAEIKRLIHSCSQSYYIVTDSTKFGNQSLNLFGTLSFADKIITDNKVPKEWEDILLNEGVKLVKVKD